MDADEEFYRETAYALQGCQLVEEQLKLYIAEALDFVRKCLGGRMPFKMTGKDYANMSLERLITTFGKLSDNPTLLKALGKFKDERNFLSHRAIAHCLDPMGELGAMSVEEVRPRVNAIKVEAQRLFTAINDEHIKFRGRLYFEDIKAVNQS
jgi:hypothetical protein